MHVNSIMYHRIQSYTTITTTHPSRAHRIVNKTPLLPCTSSTLTKGLYSKKIVPSSKKTSKQRFLSLNIQSTYAKELKDNYHNSKNEPHIKSTYRIEVKKNEKIKNKENDEGTILGAVALIIGSSIGAGILAMPAATAGPGFLPSLSTMTFSYILLTLEALLMAEVNISVFQKKKNKIEGVVSLRQMAEETLGSPIGSTLVSTVYLFLSYTLLVAFISKSGDLLNLMSSNMISKTSGEIMFTLIIGMFFWKSNDVTVDKVNRLLTIGLLSSYAIIVTMGTHNAHWMTLLNQGHWDETWTALPVIFLALVFHDLVPIICKYLNWNRHKIRKALIFGSTIPFLMFICWDAISLALVPGATEVIKEGGTIDPLRIIMETEGHGVGAVISIFSTLAIITSCLGNTFGLSEYFMSELHQFKLNFLNTKNKYKQQQSLFSSKLTNVIDMKLTAMMMTLVPPMIAALSSPDLFFHATKVAGAYGMTLLYGVLPPLMAWNLRFSNEKQNLRRKQKSSMVPGGKIFLATLTSFALCIELFKFFEDSNQFLHNIM